MSDIYLDPLIVKHILINKTSVSYIFITEIIRNQMKSLTRVPMRTVEVLLEDRALEALLFNALGFGRAKFSSKLFSFGAKMTFFERLKLI